MTRPDKQPCLCEPLDLKERNQHSATCNREARKAITNAKNKARRKSLVIREVRKVSPKMAVGLKEYIKKKNAWLPGKMCAVYPDKPAIEPHHKAGKATMELMLDETKWLPVSRDGHIYIENHPAEAKEKGWSLSRLTTEPHKTI